MAISTNQKPTIYRKLYEYTRPVMYSNPKAAFPLTRLGARRVALRRPRDRIENRSDTITNVTFPYTRLAAQPVVRAARSRTCSDFCVHPPRVHLPICHFICYVDRTFIQNWLNVSYLLVAVTLWTLAHVTQNICITFIQCWSNVEDVGPTWVV